MDVQVKILVCKEQKNKYGDEVGSWLDGLFTDGLFTDGLFVQLQRSVSCSDSWRVKLVRKM